MRANIPRSSTLHVTDTSNVSLKYFKFYHSGFICKIFTTVVQNERFKLI